MEIKFTQESLEIIQKLIKRYPEGKQKSAILPVLHIAQAEFGGWLSSEVMDYVATILNIKPIEVYEVATFYTMFNLEPVGKCVIEICRTGPCWLSGAEEIITHLEKKLNIKMGETTTDGKYTLKAVECLAACGCAPVIQVGLKYHEYMNIEKTDQLLTEYAEVEKTTYKNPYL